MTREEAINRVKSDIYQYADFSENPNEDEFWQALDMLLKQEPCEDAISRVEAVRVASGYCHPSNIAEELAKLPAVQPIRPKGYWIPVSEGMPNEFADVICCTEAKEMFIATYLGKMNDGTDCFDDHDGMMWEGDIIAWMPLPEPYEP